MEESRLLLHRDDFRIRSLNGVHEVFEINANRILELVNEELELDFTFDAHFLLKMFHGQIKVSDYAPQGFWRYRQMIQETQIQARFGGKGLVLDMAQALKMYNLPEFSAELTTCLSNCFQGLQASVDQHYFAHKDGKIIFTEEGRRDIERSNSRELLGEDVTIYQKFQSLATQLNDLVKEVNGGSVPDGVSITRLLEIDIDDNGDRAVMAVPTCVPSELENLRLLRVAQNGGRAHFTDSEGESHRLYRELHGKFLQ